MSILFALMILGIFLTGIAVMPCSSRDSSCRVQTLQKEDLPLMESAQACANVLNSIEQQKRQLQNRLQMLDEMIEKSDREIIRLHDQLSRWP